jgi:predicted metalloprotease with PDZ domain
MGLAYAIDKDAGHFEVSAIQPGGPAERADLKVGDLLLKINGRFVVNQASIGKAMDKVLPDTQIEVVVERENEILVKKVTTALVDELINY